MWAPKLRSWFVCKLVVISGGRQCGHVGAGAWADDSTENTYCGIIPNINCKSACDRWHSNRAVGGCADARLLIECALKETVYWNETLRCARLQAVTNKRDHITIFHPQRWQHRPDVTDTNGPALKNTSDRRGSRHICETDLFNTKIPGRDGLVRKSLFKLRCEGLIIEQYLPKRQCGSADIREELLV